MNNEYGGKDLYSTGFYGKDVFNGLMSGLGNAFNKPGKFYVQSNWKGNGLADSSIGYIKNQNYQNPYLTASILKTTMYNGDFDKDKEQNNYGYNRLNDVLARLSGMSGNIGKWASEKWNDLVMNKYGNIGDFPNDIA